MKTSLLALLACTVFGAATLHAQTGIRIFGAQQIQVDDNNPAHPKIYFTTNLGALGIDQTGVVTPGVFPSTCALLDLSSTTQGFLPPRLTTAQELLVCGGTPTEGLVIYNTTTHSLDVWNGSGWTGQWQTKGNTNLTADNTDNLLGSTASSSVKPFNFIVGGTRIARYQTGNDIVAGAPSNAINGNTTNSVIAGGVSNTIATNSSNSTIAGGTTNSISNNTSTIGGGNNNTATVNAFQATIAGGSANTVNAGGATIGGGFNNTNNSGTGFIGAGQGNTVGSANFSVIGGGVGNTNNGGEGFIGGGQGNTINASDWSTIGGGVGNSVSASVTTVGGGQNNAASGTGSTIGGGIGNQTSVQLATVGGGLNNIATNIGTIGGGEDNQTTAGDHGTIAGGRNHRISGTNGTIGGGAGNAVNGTNGTVSGGFGNTAGATSAIAGGGNLTLGSNSFGFNSPDNSANISANGSTAYFGNVNLWLGNTNNSAQQFRMYAPNGSTTYAGALYTSLQASAATTGTTQYALPVNYGSAIAPYVLTDASGAGTPRQLTWQSVNGIGWALTGNSGTNPATNFVGTNDNQDFVIRTNNIIRATFAGTPVAGGVKPMLNLNTVNGFQGVRINGVADAIPGPGGSTLAGTPDVWELAVVGDFVASGIIKMGGSMWFDGNSPTHSIITNKPLVIQTVTNDSLMFGTNNNTRMTIAKGGNIGIGTLNPQSPLHIVAAPPDPTFINAAGFYVPDPVNHVLTVENTMANGKGNGIAIIVHNSSSSNPITDGNSNNAATNYLTFYNDIGDHNHVRGRVEAFSAQNFNDMVTSMTNILSDGEMYNPFNYFQCNLGFDAGFISYNSNFIDVQWPTLPTGVQLCDFTFTIHTPDPLPNIDVDFGNILPCGLSGGSTGHLNFSSPFTINGSPITGITNPFSIDYNFVNSILDKIKALPYKQKIVDIISAGPAKMAIAKAAATYATAFFAGGVTYESGSGDYAEWLERADHSEKITFGDVVGTVDGKITKNTTGANQLLVASFKPCVLGNMPAVGKEADFTKVAFMGQAPVKMMCAVKKGDYIIPSGNNDGYAKAISPNDIRPEDLDKVLGVCWDNDQPEVGFKLVNIAVGLKSQEVVKIVQDQAKQIEELRSKVSDLESLKADVAALRESVSHTASKGHKSRRSLASKKQ